MVRANILKEIYRASLFKNIKDYSLTLITDKVKYTGGVLNAITRYIMSEKSFNTASRDPLLPDFEENSITVPIISKFKSELTTLCDMNREKIDLLITYCKDKLNLMLSYEVFEYNLTDIKISKEKNLIAISYGSDAIGHQKIIPELYRVLYDRYVATNPDKGIKYFHEALLCMLIRYGILGSIGYQGAVPIDVMDYINNVFDIEVECFSSPLNAYYNHFYSLFPDLDVQFGSYGSFFDKSIPMEYTHYQLNPPFIEDIELEMARKVINFVDNTVEPSLFVIFIPNWIDAEANLLLNNAKCLLLKEIIPRKDHVYIDGYRHTHFKHIQANFDTIVYIVGKNVKIPDNFSSQIKKKFISSI